MVAHSLEGSTIALAIHSLEGSTIALAIHSLEGSTIALAIHSLDPLWGLKGWCAVRTLQMYKV